jgi:predicted Fe-Mo cluster-binding NifX family protein
MTEASEARVRLAVPSEAPGGLDAARSGHFGRSPVFTIVELVDGEIAAVEAVPNRQHESGACLSPVLTLGEHGVDVVVVAGIGARPLLACAQAGIRVFAGEDRPDVRAVVEAFLDADLSPVGSDATRRH